MAKQRKLRLEKVKKGIYILPALITVCGFGCGFLSIIFSHEGNFVAASQMIFVALLCDALDGAMARATRTESKFGEQLDSLADVVSFGVAHAILLYERFGLSDHPFWIFPLLYATAGALRLARYNSSDIGASTSTRKVFRGTPIPAPAGIIAAMVLFLKGYAPEDFLDQRVVIAFVLVLSYLMVSNVRYPAPTLVWSPDRPRPFRFLIMFVIIIVFLIYRFSETVLIMGAVYYLAGPYMGIQSLIKRKKEARDEPRENANAEISDSESSSRFEDEPDDENSL